ncbi:Uncharacterised protein [Mycobacteroides abscessus subsp. abscessus]|nr:Uncharacterised protein [Mycobacteroides abscessus subsp. abscessus]
MRVRIGLSPPHRVFDRVNGTDDARKDPACRRRDLGPAIRFGSSTSCAPKGSIPLSIPAGVTAGTVTSRIFAASWCTTPDPIAPVPPRLPKVALTLWDRYPSCTSPAMAR